MSKVLANKIHGCNERVVLGASCTCCFSNSFLIMIDDLMLNRDFCHCTNNKMIHSYRIKHGTLSKWLYSTAFESVAYDILFTFVNGMTQADCTRVWIGCFLEHAWNLFIVSFLNPRRRFYQLMHRLLPLLMDDILESGISSMLWDSSFNLVRRMGMNTSMLDYESFW